MLVQGTWLTIQRACIIHGFTGKVEGIVVGCSSRLLVCVCINSWFITIQVGVVFAHAKFGETSDLQLVW